MTSPTPGLGSSAPGSVHAVFLLHGLWGYQEHMFSLRDALTSRARNDGAAIDIYCSHSYEGTRTYDGVDVCADRAIAEVHAHISKLTAQGKAVDRFSILGFSLGGLIARLVVYKLKSEGFFDRVTPCNFATFASPAIGIPKTPGLISHWIQGFSAFFLSRTGTHLYLRDRRPETGNPLVYDLATPELNSAVTMFQRVDIYCNSVGDRVVPYLSGGISEFDPFLPNLTEARRVGPRIRDGGIVTGKLHLTFEPNYPAIVSSVQLEESVASSSNEKVADPASSPINVPARPSILSLVTPWFRPSVYPFLPTPLAYVLVLLIPLVLPAVVIILGAFAIERTTSAWRVKQHLRNSSTSTQSSAAHKKDLEAGVPEPRDDAPPIDSTSGIALSSEANPANLQDAPTSCVRSMTLDLSGLHSSFEPPQRPAITPQQRTMIQNLNAALDAHPRATKHLSFLPNVWTSHQVLIVQDAKDAEHRAGESAVRHWADHFMF